MGAGAVRALRFLPALVLVVLAVFVALLAADVRSWQRTFASDDVRTSATWNASPRIPWNLAGRLLGVADDVQARRAIRQFEQTVSASARLDNALGVTSARARAETELAAVARGSGPRSSQAGTLLGILAFGDLARGGGRDPSQAETAIADFENAVRADPADEIAKFDLELVLRLLAARGVRTGVTSGSGAGSTGRQGAGGGTPGSGY
jgi:hypothetical protein